MTMLRTFHPAFVLAAALTVVCCGPLETTSYKGPPLATLSGQITATQPIDGSYQLAIAWFVEEDKGLLGIETQGVSLPADTLHYSLDFYSPPPDSVLSDDGQGGKTAWGILVAYQDLNGNGKLDPIPSGSRPIDRVLGTSFGDGPVLDGRDKYQIVFSDHDTQFGGPGPLHRGFNIIRLAGHQFNDPLGSADSIPLVLTRSTWGNLVVCQQSGAQDDLRNCLCDSPTRLFVHGSLTSNGPGAVASFEVTDCDGNVPDAAVTLNGHLIPYSQDTGTYDLSEDARSQILVGVNQFRASRSGRDQVAMDVPLATLSLLSPVDGTSVPANADLDISWSPVAAAIEYSVVASPAAGLFPFEAPNVDDTHVTVPGNQVTPGPLSILVSSFEDGTWTPNGSFVLTSAAATSSVNVTP
jgi:hypothetical protein